MKEMIIAQLKQHVGLSDEKAKQAADVVMKLIAEHGGSLAKMAGGLAGGGGEDAKGGGVGGALGGALGGLMGGGDKK